MNYPQGYTKQDISPTKSSKSEASKKISTFPIEFLSRDLKEVTKNIHTHTGMSLELIVNILLTILSFICQSLVCVASPYTNIPGPCSLYLLTMAESGEGKTFLFKLLMKPVHERLNEMNQRYQVDMTEYKRKLRVWKIAQQGLDANLRQAVKKGYGVNDAMMQLEEHCSKEPKKPVEPKFIYEDVSPKALIQGVSQQPEAGIITDEPISFFKGMLKNNIALLNKGWDGGTYYFQRADGESYDLNLCLMISLIVQPKVFMDYLEKHGEIARTSGFLARFLISMVTSSIGHRSNRVEGESLDAALQPFFKRLQKLMNIFEVRFYDNNYVKDTMELTDDAKTIWQEKSSEIEMASAPGGKLAHICDFSSKSTNTALRLAAILEYSSLKGTGLDDFISTNIISESTMKNALEISDWYLQQASDLFYPMSEQYQFEKDARDLWGFINKKLHETNGHPFPKHELEQLGPSRLRKIEKLTPVLNQLISQGFCAVIQLGSSRTLLLTGVMSNGRVLTPQSPDGQPCRCYIVQSAANTLGRSTQVDLSDMPYGGHIEMN
ncbi:TPA: YfjI family protein [Serratia fonticola]